MQTQSAVSGNSINLSAPTWIPKSLVFAWDYAVDVVVEDYLDYWYTIHDHLNSEQIEQLKREGKYFDTSEWTEEQLLAEAGRLIRQYPYAYATIVNVMKNVLTKHARLRYPNVVKKELRFAKHKGLEIAEKYVKEVLIVYNHFFPKAATLLKKLQWLYYHIGVLTHVLHDDAYPEYSAKHKRMDALFTQFYHSPLVVILSKVLGKKTFPERNERGFTPKTEVSMVQAIENVTKSPILSALVKNPVESWWPTVYPETLAGNRVPGEQIPGWKAITGASLLLQNLLQEYWKELEAMEKAAQERRHPWPGLPHGALRPDKTQLPPELQDEPTE